MKLNNTSSGMRSLIFTFGMTVLLAACDSQGGSAGDPVVFEDDPNRVTRLLTTGAAGVASENKWFCSVFRDEAYLARVTFSFLSDGTGEFKDVPFQWSQASANAVTINAAESDLTISNLVFASGNYSNDQFAGNFADGSTIACDWSGPPRLGSAPLNDATDVDPDTLDGLNEELLEAERLLLTTSDSGQRVAIWRCDLTDVDGVSDSSDYAFYPGNKGESGLEFEWFPISETDIEVVYDVAKYRLENIRFSGSTREMFTADDTRGYKLSCTWFGPPRAEPYVE